MVANSAEIDVRDLYRQSLYTIADAAVIPRVRSFWEGDSAAKKLGFSHALPVRLNTQNCAWFGSKIYVSFRGGLCPLTPSPPGTLPMDPLCSYLQILATPLLNQFLNIQLIDNGFD